MNLLRDYIRETLIQEKVLAIGQCYPFAYEKAKEWWSSHIDRSKPPGKGVHPDIDNKEKFKVVHGRVTNKWNGESALHAWVEMGDMIFDDQTKSTKPNGIDRETYYDMYQPEPHNEYTAEDAVSSCMKKGHPGPWDDESLESMRQRDAWLREAGELGRQIFADRAPMGRHMGTEIDTELEERIWDALYSHLHGLNSKIPQNLLDAIISFSKDPAYNDVFMLYAGGDAYRGMEVSEEYLDENAPGWREATFSGKKGYWKWSDLVPVNFEYQNRNESRTVSSWSPTPDVAETFGRSGMGMVGVVLIADSATNTFLDLKELYRFHRLDDFEWEEEIIGFGSIRVKGIKILKRLGS